MPDDRPPLIFVPGLLSDDTVWRPVAEILGEAQPSIFAELPTVESITDMAQSVLDSVSGPLHVAGHSMGGRVALEMVRLAPERILKLALADTGTHRRKPGEEQSRQTVIDLAHQHGMKALADTWLPPMVHPERHGDENLMSALTAMVLRNDADRHEAQIKALLNRPEAEAVLATIDCPVLLMVGRQDTWSPLNQHEHMLAEIPDANLAVIEDAGHFAPIERPKAVAAAVRDWLKENPMD